MIRKRQDRAERRTVQLSPQLERRRALRREKRRELLIHVWRFFVLLLASAGFGWLLLRFGWTLNDQEQLVVQGDIVIKPELVARVDRLNADLRAANAGVTAGIGEAILDVSKLPEPTPQGDEGNDFYILKTGKAAVM